MAAEAPASAAERIADQKAEELAAIVQEIRARVRARFPEGLVGHSGITLTDLHPLMRARDAAEAKVAAIGNLNPRPPGFLNSIIQAVKRQIGRALYWFVRDQVDFNRAVMVCVEETMSALNGMNQVLYQMGTHLDTTLSRMDVRLETKTEALLQEASELKDIRVHWLRWREEWQLKLSVNEAHFLRSVAELQNGFHHRTLLMEHSFNVAHEAQHTSFTAAIEKATLDIQKQLWQDQQRLWHDFENIRLEYERLIHTELRMVRQRAAASGFESPPPVVGPSAHALEFPFDYARFADRFRGSDEYVRRNQQFYLPYFKGRKNVLDVGCGRGEFLALMKEANVPARGVDSDTESVGLSKALGHEAECADLFDYLRRQPPMSLDGVFCSQVVEHLPPERVPEFVKLVAIALDRNGLLAIETPNPECLAIFATHFYLDPTHTRPIPSALMTFYLQEFGFGQVEVHKLSPAVESMPSLYGLPVEFRDAFFGALDYAIIGRKL